MLAGNLGSIVIGGIIAIAVSLIVSERLSTNTRCNNPFNVKWPEDYDFADTRAINSRVHPHNEAKGITEVNVPYMDEKKAQEDSSASSLVNDSDLDPVGLNKAFKFAAWSSVALVCTEFLVSLPGMSDELLSFVQTLILMILIPLPLFGASTIYSVSGFSVWVVVGIIWTFCSAFAVVLYPLWESRAALTMITRGIIKVIAHATFYL